MNTFCENAQAKLNKLLYYTQAACHG
uniref:Uncharacterized protein n=1 Tax=Tetranychus urticae TaxID=32264 RepID=T1L103_TETUR